MTAAALLLAACGGGAGTGSEAATDAASPADDSAGTDVATVDAADVEVPEDALSVVAAFYPLEFLAGEVGGDRVEVTGLTPPGAEAHDLELSPQSLALLGEADLLVMLSEFQPALDDALSTTSAPVVDLADVADRPYDEDADGHDDDEHGHDDDEHGHNDDEHGHDDDEHGHDDDAHDHGDTDPHFWLDPMHMAEAAEMVAGALSEADPDHADTYRDNADALVAELTDLDEQAQEAFASCEVPTLVTAHDAFGYFADRYGFEVRSINGLSPDQEPSARTLAELSDFVADSDIRVVYTETLVSSAVADTVAAEAGVETAVLDPIEGITDASPGSDYREIMRSNVETVRAGQACA